MNSQHERPNKLLDQLFINLQEYNKLRHQLPADLQFYLENIDQINNTPTYQEKFAQEQTEINIILQKEKREINAWLHEKLKEQIERINELFEYQQRYYDKLKSIQENDSSSLTIKQLEKILQELDIIKKTHQRYIQMLFDTIKECQQQILFLNDRVEEIDKKIKKCEDAIFELDEIIVSKNKEIDKNKELILILDKKVEGLRQERYQIIEKAFLDTTAISQLNLLTVKSDDIHLMGLIHQVDLIRQGMAIIELNHAGIIKELNDALAKKEVDRTIIEREINNIVKKILEENYKEFLSKEDIIYLIKGLTEDAYYKQTVGQFISEIMQSKNLPQELNENLISINLTEKELDQRYKEQDKLKTEVSDATGRRKELTEERTVLKQERTEVISEFDQVNALKSSCEQIMQHEEIQQKTSASARDSIKELLARKRREKELKNSNSQSPLTSGPAFFEKRPASPAANDSKLILKSKEEPSLDKSDQAGHSQDASDNASSSENKKKKLG